MKTIKRLVFAAIAATSAAAVIQELQKPEAERTWHGDVLGIPYDFRMPSFQRIKESMWNPEDPRLFVPRPIGVGWSVNVARLLQLIREESETASDDGA